MFFCVGKKIYAICWYKNFLVTVTALECQGIFFKIPQ